MKKYGVWIPVLLVAILLLPFGVGAQEAQIGIYLNGEALVLGEGMGAPFIDGQSRTQIPLRAVSEGLGYPVDWNGQTKTVTIFMGGGQAVRLKIGERVVNTPGGPVEMDTAAVIIGSRTYVPLRFVAEALGHSVDYSQNGYHRIDIGGRITSVGFYRPEPGTLPEEIKSWVENSKMVPLAQERVVDGKRYVLITAGEKPTGGYAVTVEEVREVDDHLEVVVRFTRPAPGQMVIQVLTYPYDLVVLENETLPITVKDMAEPENHIMGLVGLDYIDRPVVAASDWIKLFSPAPESRVDSVITLAGIANVFEGTVIYEIMSVDGQSLVKGFVTAAMGDWGYFAEEIPLPGDESSYLLSVYSESARDGSKMFEIRIPVERG